MHEPRQFLFFLCVSSASLTVKKPFQISSILQTTAATSKEPRSKSYLSEILRYNGS